jgi:hypothetical protein
VLAASLAAAAMTASAARAADLDEGPPPDRYGSVYDDHRYADVYKYPDRPPGYVVPAPPPYAVVPPPRGQAFKEYDDYGSYPGPRRYSYSDPRFGGHCVPRAEIKDRLLSQGWRDFHDADLRGDLATVRARRASGRLFSLTVDRCSGEIVEAHPLEPRRFGPYAYGAPQWRHPRPFF